MKGGASRVALRDLEFWDPVTTCINVQDANADIDMDGLIFHPPATSNTHAAIEFPSGSAASKVSVHNSRLLRAWTRGVYIIAGATVTGLSVQHNDLSAATSAGVTNSGTLAGEVNISGNAGYPTRKVGTRHDR